MYIVFEGIIGSGKTTQSKLLVDFLKEKFPDKKILWTKEPGGSEIADEIRRVVQAMKFNEEMNPICEAYLYASSRAQTLRSVIKPVLDNGGIVVSDRSFFTSLTNQAYGRELGFRTVWQINKVAVDKFIPDIVIYIDIDLDRALARTFDEKGDKFESLGKDFYQKVVRGYDEVFEMPMFKDKVIKIDGNRSIEEISDDVKSNLPLSF